MNDPLEHGSGDMPSNDAPLLLNLVEAADALRISRWALYQLINKRRLKTVRIQSRRLVARADLTTLVEELRMEGGE